MKSYMDAKAEREAILRANDSFYRALEHFELDTMDELWLPAPWVRCVHPGWDVIVGWESIRQSFEQIFANTVWIRVIPTVVEARVFGEVGVVTCAENITAKNDDEVGVAVAQATNLFQRVDQRWRMIHHHASPAPVRVTQPFNGTVQ